MSLDHGSKSPSLHFEPFSGHIRPLSFCRVPSIRRFWDSLLETHASHKIVEGPVGSGKSTLALYWQGRHPKETLLIQCASGLNQHNIMKKWRIMGMKDPIEWLARWRFVLLDDADLLPADTQQWLLEMAKITETSFIWWSKSKTFCASLSDVESFRMPQWRLEDIEVYTVNRVTFTS